MPKGGRTLLRSSRRELPATPTDRVPNTLPAELIGAGILVSGALSPCRISQCFNRIVTIHLLISTTLDRLQPICSDALRS